MQYINPQESVFAPITATHGGTNLSSPGNTGNVLTSTGTAWISVEPTMPVLTGDVSNSGNYVILDTQSVISKQLVGYVPAAGVISPSDSILQAIQKLSGNVANAMPFSGATIDSGTGVVTFESNVVVPGNTVVDISAETIILVYLITQYRSVRLQCQVSCTAGTDNQMYQLSDLVIIHNGTTASIAEYGVVQTGNSLVEYAVTIFGNELRISAIPTAGDTITIRLISNPIPL